jgi:TPR repeat protein
MPKNLPIGFHLQPNKAIPPAEWEHGLNLLGGTGLSKDEALGITFIRKAAENKYEGVLQFIADAYEEGKFGFQKDPQLATFWREKIQNDDVIHYWASP